jgi:hypothetical protein
MVLLVLLMVLVVEMVLALVTVLAMISLTPNEVESQLPPFHLSCHHPQVRQFPLLPH